MSANREQILRDVIALAQHLIDNPQIPVDPIRVSYCISDDNDERGVAELARIADALGVQITNSGGKPARDGDRHFYARKMFGVVEYEAFYVLRQEMEDYSAFMATRKAWKASQPAADVAPPAGDAVAAELADPAVTAPDDEDVAALATAPVIGEHGLAVGRKGGPGDCGAECFCGLGWWGFDNLAEALALLNEHVANPDPRDQVDPFRVLPDETADNAVHSDRAV